MKSITQKQLLGFINDYFSSIGLADSAETFFTTKNFSKALILKLPSVCLVPANKPKESRSGQTHIHITGSNRYFFFEKSKVDNATSSTNDSIQKVDVSKQNIKALNKESLTSNDLDIINSFTMVKIAYRSSQNSQVQISKLREDGSDFIDLRRSLYENDLLIFLKYRTNDKMLAIGIPRAYYEGNFEFSADFFTSFKLTGQPKISVKNALNRVVEEFPNTAVINGDESISDAVYQEMVNSAEPSNTSYRPEKYIATHSNEKYIKSTRPTTNPSIGKEAIKDSNYCCTINSNHETFIKKDGTPYMEVHHLIPLEWQNEFQNKLDTKANLVPLCPLCHKFIHYGRMDDKKSMIIQLYNDRRKHLEESGLYITIEKLITLYE